MRKVTSWTWFTSALLFLAALCPPPAQVAALAALGWTDPVAGAPPPPLDPLWTPSGELIGRLHPPVSRKSAH
eukprot:541348-Prorocentrum_minimum.AAC.1